jgi:YD repeat-containing protein
VDTPFARLPKVLLHPEGARSDFARDVFGKPTALSRSGGTPNAWNGRYYVYDAQQRLCKRVELETGTTSMQYDAAGNLVREATGLPWSDTTSCAVDAAAFDARAVHRTWDARNRLTALAFPDGSGDQAWSYTPDGQPARIETRNGTTLAVNTYAYNARGLPAAETLAQPGWHDWTFATQYDALGNIAAHVYPKETITYQPTHWAACGRPSVRTPTRTDVRFHTNGALRSFTYGNGIVHSGVAGRAQAAGTRARPPRRHARARRELRLRRRGQPRRDQRRQAGRPRRSHDGIRRLDRLVATQSRCSAGALHLRRARQPHPRRHRRRTRPRPPLLLRREMAPDQHQGRSCTGESVVGLGYDAQGNLENRNGQAYRFDFGNRLREATGQEHYRYDGHGRACWRGAPPPATSSPSTTATVCCATRKTRAAESMRATFTCRALDRDPRNDARDRRVHRSFPAHRRTRQPGRGDRRQSRGRGAQRVRTLWLLLNRPVSNGRPTPATSAMPRPGCCTCSSGITTRRSGGF